MRLNRFREAFKENANLLGMGTAVALSAALLNPLPLLVGLVAEAAYLLFVPDSQWYEARLAKRFDAEVEQRRQNLKAQVLPTLRPELRARFSRLEDTRRQINIEALEDKTWYREVLRKLDYLLEKFLLFASKEAQFHSYLQSLHQEVSGVRPHVESRYDLDLQPQPTNRRNKNRRRDWDDVPNRPLQVPVPDPVAEESPDAIDRHVQELVEEVQAYYEHEMTGVRELIEKEPDNDTRAVLEKRADVLQRRQEFAGKIGKILTNLEHQLQLVEDTFGLINDEIRARSPEQVLADIEEVVVATDTMTQALEEMAPYEQMAARLSGG